MRHRATILLVFIFVTVAASYRSTGHAKDATVPKPDSSVHSKNNKPNILLIVSEDNGPELGCYGDQFVKTLNLDKLAAQGVRFENAYVPHAVCSVSRASFLTGLYPFQHGQIGLATHRYAMFRKWENIPSILKKQGYRTGLMGKLHVNPESAFPFDFRWADPKAISFGKRDVRKIAEVAGKFFRQSPQNPFFLSVNFSDAHFPALRQQHGLPEKPLAAKDVKSLPFIGADSPNIRKGVANYYNCLMRLDTGIGMLLKQLEESGRSKNTLIIYIGDHGAQFSRGKGTCFEGGLRIPMIVRLPNQVKRAVVRKELVSTIDLLPTILEIVGLKKRASLPGKSLLPLCKNQKVAWRKYLFAERTAFNARSFFPQRTIRDAQYKLILNLTPERSNPVAGYYGKHDGSFFIYGTTEKELARGAKQIQQAYRLWKNPPQVELYDLENDPWEFNNLSGQPKLVEVQKRLLAALLSFRKKHNDPLLDSAKLKKLAAEHDDVAKNQPRGRYPKGKSWNYLKYLQPKLTEEHGKQPLQ